MNQPATSPCTLMNLVQNLYETDPQFVQLNPDLFQLYIPGLQPARDLEIEEQEAKNFIAEYKSRVPIPQLSPKKRSQLEALY